MNNKSINLEIDTEIDNRFVQFYTGDEPEKS